MVRDLGVMIDDQLIFSNHVALALYNIRKIRPYLTQHATQLLTQAAVVSSINFKSHTLTDKVVSSTASPTRRPSHKHMLPQDHRAAPMSNTWLPHLLVQANPESNSFLKNTPEDPALHGGLSLLALLNK